MTTDCENEALTLVIMAAGLGSRFGGDKQLAALGPNDETMLELAIVSACRAGFSGVVLVIRPELESDIEALFNDSLNDKLDAGFSHDFCYQAMDDLPEVALAHLSDVNHREKPWGTAHALWSARKKVKGRMAVINADDYYGDTAFELLASGLNESKEDWMLVAYPLSLTLSEHGGVNRGVCLVKEGLLQSVAEWTDIRQSSDEGLVGTSKGERGVLSPSVPVSMTCWGFTQDIFLAIEAELIQFISVYGQEAKSECFLPDVVQHSMSKAALINNLPDAKRVRVKTAQEPWFGVTYPQDAVWVRQKLSKLLNNKSNGVISD
ncbi:NTP transferase domain-containing protein [Shewanella woodyi]|uniref:MobA-like NTP transferase domain-containing protein n=1 Tax=Shewanella woodyi (strain ATCC 51908 / MS32) TaxID=392500 RepID=B1KLU9_SHEWM|nr:NTP transferase domain-containing protein [Shewanella woodyi]ACA88829.1 conserved hypothetical protein [Shewanella woodyi ATCC 51908]